MSESPGEADEGRGRGALAVAVAGLCGDEGLEGGVRAAQSLDEESTATPIYDVEAEKAALQASWAKFVKETLIPARDAMRLPIKTSARRPH